MSRLNAFLEELTNHELAQFYLHRYQEFLKGSKEKIDSEFERRGLKQEHATNYTQIPENANELIQAGNICPICYSEKFYTATEIETISYSYASEDIEVDYKKCLVCHHSEAQNETSGTGRKSIFGFISALANRRR